MILSLLIYAVVASFTPGPNNLMSLYYANQVGFKKSIRFSLGVFAGFVIILGACAVFSTSLALVFPKVEWVMKVIGFIYMIYLAYKIFKSSSSSSSSFSDKNNSFPAGLLLQFLNPKGVIYSLTVIATFVTPHYHTLISQTLWVVVLAFIAFLGTVCWALFGSVFNALISRHEKVFNMVMALLLIYTAFSILFE